MSYATHRSPLRRWYICSAGLLGLTLLVSLTTGTFQFGGNFGRNVAATSSLLESASTVSDGHADSVLAKRGSSSTARVIETYGRLPLSFEPNDGQTNPEVKFLSHGRGYTLFLTRKEAVLALQKPSAVSPQLSVKGKWRLDSGKSKLETRNASRLSLESAISNLRFLVPSLEYPAPRSIAPAPTPQPPAPDVVRLELVGANPQARVVGLDELPGKSNYFIGNDPKKWRTNVPTYAKVRYADVYPGIDLVYYGKNSEVRGQKSEGESEAGAEWRAQLEYDFVVAPGADPKAIRFFMVGAKRFCLGSDGDLLVEVGNGEVHFQKPVVYQLAAGAGLRAATSAARNPKSKIGNPKSLDGQYVLLAGNRLGFEVRGYDRSRPLIIDPLVLSYSTYLGGSSQDVGQAIAVDGSGNAYVTGSTASTDFPTANPLQATNHGGPSATPLDAFVAEINAAGSALVYSTYLGGSGNDVGQGIAVDGSGNAYVTGWTGSTDFPTVNPLQATNNAWNTASQGTSFVAKLNAAGSALVYSTYLGGTSSLGNPSKDVGQAIAVDASGNAYVTGLTTTTDFPTVNPLQATNNASIYGTSFVAKLNAAGSALIYSTYLGGSGADVGQAIAADASGNAYVTGTTSSSNFPTVNPLQATDKTSISTLGTSFVAKLNAAGSALVYSTYLGGSDSDQGIGIAVDSFGNAYVTGITTSNDFPTVNPIQATIKGFHDPAYQGTSFVAKLNAAGSALVYSTYLGGSIADQGLGIAVDDSGNAYVTGWTLSDDFPTVNPLQAMSHQGVEDAFIAEINAAGSALVYSTYLGGSTHNEGLGIAVDSSGNAYVTGYTESTDFPTANPLQATNHGNGDAFVAKLSLVALPAITLTPSTLTFANQTVGTTSAAQTVTLTNSGDASLIISAVALEGTNASDFTNSADTCSGATLLPNQTCAVSVTFAPTASGIRTGALTITDNASKSPQSVSLTGTGMSGPQVTLSSTSISFPNQYVGTSGLPINVTLTNSGGQPLTISSVQAGGDFGATSGCTSSLSAGVNCTIGVFFDPSASGLRTGNLTITDNAPGSPQTVALSGNGEDFSVAAASGSSTSATVTAGQTATYNLSVAPLSGLSGSVNLTCNGAPSQATCTVNPSSVSLSGSAAVPTTATVSTTAPSAVGMRPKPPAGPWIGLWMLGLLAAAGARLMGGRRLAWRRAWAPLAAAMMLSLTLWAACGGGPATTPLQQPGTPAGDYTLTVTGSYTAGATTLNHSIPLKLTVH